MIPDGNGEARRALDEVDIFKWSRLAFCGVGHSQVSKLPQPGSTSY
jgi:hypothetical protein